MKLVSGAIALNWGWLVKYHFDEKSVQMSADTKEEAEWKWLAWRCTGAGYSRAGGGTWGLIGLDCQTAAVVRASCSKGSESNGQRSSGQAATLPKDVHARLCVPRER